MARGDWLIPRLALALGLIGGVAVLPIEAPEGVPWLGWALLALFVPLALVGGVVLWLRSRRQRRLALQPVFRLRERLRVLDDLEALLGDAPDAVWVRLRSRVARAGVAGGCAAAGAEAGRRRGVGRVGRRHRG